MRVTIFRISETADVRPQPVEIAVSPDNPGKVSDLADSPRRAGRAVIGEDGTVTETPAVQDPVAPPRRNRGRESIRDMVLSLSVVLGVVFVVLLVGMRGGPPTQTVHEVGYTAQLVQAREVASYDVLAPVGLPQGWKATSVRGLTADGTVTWHLGFVTPHGRYAALEQSAGAAQPFVDDFADGAKAAGRARIGGRVWQRLEGGSPERRALVLHGTGVTTVVAGGASWGDLETLARSLRGKAG